MFVVPPFWQAAAREGHRLDLSVGLAQGPVVDARPAQLTRWGVPLDLALSLQQGEPIDSTTPFLTLDDPHYPAPLRFVPYAPPVLFTRGDTALLEEPGVAIVGTRRCTGSGRLMARRLARDLSGAGFVVVSGMAYGVDTEAHLTAPARTIAVLGAALDAPMSAAQGRVAATILDAGGLLVSEFLPGTHATRYTFPRRNRVIAGLARATVVVEARHRSGALITARHAADLGREVLAVPGSPLVDASAGCLGLLENGARIARDGRDVQAALGADPQARPRARPADPLGVLEKLSGVASFDALMDATGADVSSLSQALAALELTGMVQRLPGDRYATLDTR